MGSFPILVAGYLTYFSVTQGHFLTFHRDVKTKGYTGFFAHPKVIFPIEFGSDLPEDDFRPTNHVSNQNDLESRGLFDSFFSGYNSPPISDKKQEQMKKLDNKAENVSEIDEPSRSTNDPNAEDDEFDDEHGYILDAESDPPTNSNPKTGDEKTGDKVIPENPEKQTVSTSWWPLSTAGEENSKMSSDSKPKPKEKNKIGVEANILNKPEGQKSNEKNKSKQNKSNKLENPPKKPEKETSSVWWPFSSSTEENEKEKKKTLKTQKNASTSGNSKGKETESPTKEPTSRASSYFNGWFGTSTKSEKPEVVPASEPRESGSWFSGWDSPSEEKKKKEKMNKPKKGPIRTLIKTVKSIVPKPTRKKIKSALKTIPGVTPLRKAVKATTKAMDAAIETVMDVETFNGIKDSATEYVTNIGIAGKQSSQKVGYKTVKLADSVLELGAGTSEAALKLAATIQEEGAKSLDQIGNSFESTKPTIDYINSKVAGGISQLRASNNNAKQGGKQMLQKVTDMAGLYADNDDGEDNLVAYEPEEKPQASGSSSWFGK